jgi:hypothetical protein
MIKESGLMMEKNGIDGMAYHQHEINTILNTAMIQQNPILL